MTSNDIANTHNTIATNTPAAPVWTSERIRALGPITDLATAATILQIGRALAYQMARAGTFPVPTIRVGVRYRVPVAPILELLHLAPGDLTNAPPRSVDHQQQPGDTTPGTDTTAGAK
jgi:hypothetical protein